MTEVSVRIKQIGKPLTGRNLDIRAAKKRVQAKEARLVKKDFEKTAKTFRNKPTFIIQITPRGANVLTRDANYIRLDKGTPPHTIRPKKPGGVLAFNATGFKPKTSATSKQLAARSGRPAQPPTVFAKEVQHPGTKARRFAKRVAAKSQPRLAKAWDAEFRKLARSSR